ncbi:agip121 [Agrotis ipsilon multiple nucleopolyhedrovirus]|uniref:Uncharacterized protein n=1 Tax=Agrotis ipsilon multiple nucleopolyhedrovirus TaxID=208013 RepID=B6D635_9ABAC|nr:agip121 [Agrotis ipsilon multiple nucleopolyhedrovirus]ACI28822.1 unknown [Agrotis ipsilon multiple nucleopolyhedrovirus]
MTFGRTLAFRSTCRRSLARGGVFNRRCLEFGSQSQKVCQTRLLSDNESALSPANMSQLSFKLGEVIDNTVDNKLRSKNNRETLASFYDKRKSDVAQVGRSTTYDVVGKRDYKTLFDEKKYKF